MNPVMKLINKTCDLGNNTVIQPVTEIVRGMATVFNHSFRAPVTLEYPEVKPNIPPRSRGKLALLRKPDGSFACTGCKMCQRVCPCMDLIQIESTKVETPEGKKQTVIEKYTIDLGRCINCGNCTEACKVNCLVFVEDFEYSEFSREALVYTKDMLLLSVEESNEWRKKHGKE